MTRRLNVERIDRGPMATHGGRLTIACGHDLEGGWRVIIGLTTRHAVPADDMVSADFDPGDVETVIEALRSAAAEAARHRLS